MPGMTIAAVNPSSPRKAPNIAKKPIIDPSERSNSPTISGMVAAKHMQVTTDWTTRRFCQFLLVRNCGLRIENTMISARSNATLA